MTAKNQSDSKRTRSAGRRMDVLRAVKVASAPSSIAEIAERLGVHPNTVRFHLDSLIENGQVEYVQADRKTPGRPPLRFQATRRMDPTGPRRYQLLATVLAANLADAPGAEARATEVGRAWGHRITSESDSEVPRKESIGRLINLLDNLGFAPERSSDGERIGLHHCPFLELAETDTRVVCPVHLGLMQGAMSAWESSATVDRLEAFVEPDLCVAHLAPAGAGQ